MTRMIVESVGKYLVVTNLVFFSLVSSVYSATTFICEYRDTCSGPCSDNNIYQANRDPFALVVDQNTKTFTIDDVDGIPYDESGVVMSIETSVTIGEKTRRADGKEITYPPYYTKAQFNTITGQWEDMILLLTGDVHGVKQSGDWIIGRVHRFSCVERSRLVGR